MRNFILITEFYWYTTCTNRLLNLLVLNTWIAILLIIIKRSVNKKYTVFPLIDPFVIGTYGTGDEPSEYSV